MYVGITRAKKRLYITRAEQRLLYGATRYKMPSRFLKEIPSEYIENTDTKPKRAMQSASGGFGASSGFGGGRSSYIHAASQPKKPAMGRPAAAESKPKASFNVGDTVRHGVFGDGKVVSAVPMGGDTLLEVEFAVGKKKLMAKFAPITKV